MSSKIQWHLYLVSCADLRAVKIGIAMHPFARMHQLQSACPAKLEMLSYAPSCWAGAKLEERTLHNLFCDLRLLGEWFKHEGELLRRSSGLTQIATRNEWLDTFPELKGVGMQ